MIESTAELRLNLERLTEALQAEPQTSLEWEELAYDLAAMATFAESRRKALQEAQEKQERLAGFLAWVSDGSNKTSAPT